MWRRRALFCRQAGGNCEELQDCTRISICEMMLGQASSLVTEVCNPRVSACGFHQSTIGFRPSFPKFSANQAHVTRLELDVFPVNLMTPQSFPHLHHNTPTTFTRIVLWIKTLVITDVLQKERKVGGEEGILVGTDLLFIVYITVPFALIVSIKSNLKKCKRGLCR